MQLALHSHWLHYFIVALVVLDALIVLFELLLDVGAFGKGGGLCVVLLETLLQCLTGKAFTCIHAHVMSVLKQ